MNGVVMLVAVLVTLVALKQIIDRDWMGLLLTETAAGSLRIHSDGGMRHSSIPESAPAQGTLISQPCAKVLP